MSPVLTDNVNVMMIIHVLRDKYVAMKHAVQQVNSVRLVYVPLAQKMHNAVALANVAMVFVVPKGPPVVIINVATTIVLPLMGKKPVVVATTIPIAPITNIAIQRNTFANPV
jgi:hypothetical protein